MGCGDSKVGAINPNAVDLTHFEIERVLGQGGFGKVNAVTKLSGSDKDMWYAMKALNKEFIVCHKSYDEGFQEMGFLKNLQNPFICNAHYAFQDDLNLYLVMDVALGGDIRFHLNNTAGKHFDEARAKFYFASLCLALEYLHGKNILHRDIKPDNMLMDSGGYVKLTDLGISWKAPGAEEIDNCSQSSGTHGYMAPEIYLKKHVHGRASDCFSAGVMLHEMLAATRPYPPDSFKCLAKTATSRFHARPGNFGDALTLNDKIFGEHSAECRACVVGLIEKSPRERLGKGGMKEVMECDWLKTFDWEALQEQNMPVPFTPDTSQANCDTGENDLMDALNDDEDKPPEKSNLSEEEQGKFAGYKYNTTIRRQTTIGAIGASIRETVTGSKGNR